MLIHSLRMLLFVLIAWDSQLHGTHQFRHPHQLHQLHHPPCDAQVISVTSSATGPPAVGFGRTKLIIGLSALAAPIFGSSFPRWHRIPPVLVTPRQGSRIIINGWFSKFQHLRQKTTYGPPCNLPTLFRAATKVDLSASREILQKWSWRE